MYTWSCSGMSDYSILRNITRAEIRHDPYVHVVIENCLPTQLYAELAGSYPADETILRLGKSAPSGRPPPNSPHDVGALRILQNADCFSQHWLELVRYHVSREFFQEVVRLLGPELVAVHPGLEQ